MFSSNLFVRAIAFAIALSCVLATASARAFCRTTTQGLADGCTPGGDDCCVLGKPIFWESQCVSYRVHSAGSPKRGLTQAQVSELAARAFGAWTQPNATCTPGVNVVELAPVTSTRSGDGLNVISFADEVWNHHQADDHLAALTTVRFETTTGRILEADIELNSANVDLSSGPAAGKIDVGLVLMHEAGHFLGLSHATSVAAIMHATVYDQPNRELRLDADDERAICDEFPTRQTRKAADGPVPATPCNFAALPPGRTCDDPDISHGCAVARRSTASDGLAVLLALAWLVARRRRSS